VVIRSRMRIPDHLSSSLTIAEYRILGDVLVFLIYSHRPIFTTLDKMTDADKRMNPQHFWSDPADIRIWIWINLRILIWIPISFAEVRYLGGACTLSAQSTYYYYYKYWSRYDKPSPAARCCHVGNELTNFTGDRRQTNKQAKRQTLGFASDAWLEKCTD